MTDYSEKSYLRPSWWSGPLSPTGALTEREIWVAVQLLAIVYAFAFGYYFADILEACGL
jgi:hypothetical protein